MSVLLGDRKESKFEAITYSIELHDMLILLMQRGFGVKDVDSFVRKKYAYGEISEENFAKYRELMRSFKSKVNQCASLITSNVRAANTIYPRTMAQFLHLLGCGPICKRKASKKMLKQRCLLDWHMTGSCILECRILTVGV